LERGRVRLGDQVGLAHPGQALDRGAVEADALGERPLQLGRGDRHRFQHPEHVGEPEPDEPHVPLLDGSQYVLLLLVHAAVLPDLLRCCRCSDGTHHVSPATGGAAAARTSEALFALGGNSLVPPCAESASETRVPGGGCPVVGARWWVPGGWVPGGWVTPPASWWAPGPGPPATPWRPRPRAPATPHAGTAPRHGPPSARSAPRCA